LSAKRSDTYTFTCPASQPNSSSIWQHQVVQSKKITGTWTSGGGSSLSTLL